jgi:hypothetical protein
MKTAPEILVRLKGVRKSGGGWAAYCPAHDDRKASLSISEDDASTKILVHCHAGCQPEEVCRALGIEIGDLFLKEDRTVARPGKVARKLVDQYDYVDEGGKLLSQVLRFDPKAFSQRRPDGQGNWISNLDGTRRVLYQLPEVIEAEQVLVVEGEKDVETARRFGIVATCSPGGAGKWRAEYAEALSGKKIIIIPDADEPGRRHAQQILASLSGKASCLKLLELPGSKDLSEWVERGGSRDQLLGLIAQEPSWAPPDGAMLVRKMEEFIGRYLILPLRAVLPLALWAIATHCFDVFDAFAYLTLTSPTPRCGKTRLLEVMELIVKDPLRATNASEAALFRGIEKFQPTLLLDEAETLSSKGERAEYLRAVVNAGNRRGAHVLRCEGKPPSPEKFNVFCPKIIAQIGAPPTTILDRSIVIPMQRRKPGEQIARFLMRIAEPEGAELQKGAASWCDMHRSEIERAYEVQPLDSLSDRDAESWQPLFSVLAVAAPSRVAELKTCADVLTGEKSASAEDESSYLRLLADVRQIFELFNTDRFSSAELVERLLRDETAPWIEFDRGKPLTQRGLARMLGRFGVSPRAIRLLNGSTPRGYLREQFFEPWARYLASPDDEPPRAQQVQQPNDGAGPRSFFEVQQDSVVADNNTPSPPDKQRFVAPVADTTLEGEGLVSCHVREDTGSGAPLPEKCYRPEPLLGGGWRCECGAIITSAIDWSKHTGIGGCPLRVRT